MARRADQEALRQRQAVQERVKFLLEYHWGGNQHAMARDCQVTQPLVSKIVRGLQGAGRRFLTALAGQPGLDSEWVLRGVGQPFLLSTKGTLPVALGILPGPPEAHQQLLTGQCHPAAEALERPTRYWLLIQAGSLLVRADLAIVLGDLLLMEGDVAWTRRLDLVEGRLCGVRLQQGEAEPSYELGRVYSDHGRLFLNTLRTAAPATPLPIPSPASPSMPTGPERPAPDLPDYRPRRRTLRPLDREERRAEARRRAEEQALQGGRGGQPEPLPAPMPAGVISISLEDVVAVCIYLARPSPVFAPAPA